MRFRIIIICLLLSAFYTSDSKAVVILQYHHVSDSTPSSTSISVEQFTLHMNYLKEQEFKVLPLDTIIEGLKQGEEFDQKTVAITFDDGYLDILSNADPVLQELEFPYSIFITPENTRDESSTNLSWPQLNAMSENNVLILNHSFEHLHLNRQNENETVKEWKHRIKNDIIQAQILIDENIATQPKYLAYPYGEYNTQLLELVKSMGYVAFGQHSGALSPKSDFTSLPRFTVSGRYANLETLKVKLQTMVMPITKLVNNNPQLDQHTSGNIKRPKLTATLDLSDIYKPTLACYILGEKVEPTWINNTTFSIESSVDLPAGRSRYNCTAQSRTSFGYYWFSQPWISRKEDGEWAKG